MLKCLAVALALATPLCLLSRADAATAYVLNFTTFSPYSKHTVAGPFATFQLCQSVLGQQSYVPGGSYSCDVVSY